MPNTSLVPLPSIGGPPSSSGGSVTYGSSLKKGAAGRALPPALAAWVQSPASSIMLSSGANTALAGYSQYDDTPARTSTSHPYSSCGVSLHFLKLLADSIQAQDSNNPDVSILGSDGSTGNLASRFVAPVVRMVPKARCFWDIMHPSYIEKPTYYIVHAWKSNFQGLVDQLYEALCPGLEDTQLAWKHHAEPLNPEQVYVWLDIFAMPPPGPAGMLSGQQANQQAEKSLAASKEAILAAEKGTLFLLDSDLSAISRSWCMWECWATVYHTQDPGRLQVVLPDDLGVQSLLGLRAQLERLDVTKLEASRNEDKQRVCAEIKGSCGMKRCQTLLQDSLLRAVRDRLRWEGAIKEAGLYCVLVLEMGMPRLAQQVLSVIPELRINDKQLQEIKGIYNTYDSDGGGSLDRAEFAAMLRTAGYSDEEAVRIFHEVDVDGGGSVEYKEFETWWVASQTQEDSARYRSGGPRLGPDEATTTLEALTANLEGWVRLLEREELIELASYTRRWMMQGARLGGRLKEQLDPLVLLGDWEVVGDAVSSRLAQGDLRAAAKLIHALLTWNSDALHVHISSLGDMPAEGAPDEVAINLVLAQYMEAYSVLVRQAQGGMANRQANYFSKAAELLRCGAASGVFRPVPRSLWLAGADKTTGSIIRSIAQFRHGDELDAEGRHIKEAKLELGQYLASVKGGPGGRISGPVCFIPSPPPLPSRSSATLRTERSCDLGPAGSSLAGGLSFTSSQASLTSVHHARPGRSNSYASLASTGAGVQQSRQSFTGSAPLSVQLRDISSSSSISCPLPPGPSMQQRNEAGPASADAVVAGGSRRSNGSDSLAAMAPQGSAELLAAGLAAGTGVAGSNCVTVAGLISAWSSSRTSSPPGQLQHSYSGASAGERAGRILVNLGAVGGLSSIPPGAQAPQPPHPQSAPASPPKARRSLLNLPLTPFAASPQAGGTSSPAGAGAAVTPPHTTGGPASSPATAASMPTPRRLLEVLPYGGSEAARDCSRSEPFYIPATDEHPGVSAALAGLKAIKGERRALGSEARYDNGGGGPMSAPVPPTTVRGREMSSGSKKRGTTNVGGATGAQSR